MKDVIVTRDVLEIYDKYDGDFDLLYERSASKKDRRKVTLEQTMLFSEYVEKLQLLRLTGFSEKMMKATRKRVLQLEEVIDKDVVQIIKQRIENGERL